MPCREDRVAGSGRLRRKRRVLQELRRLSALLALLGKGALTTLAASLVLTVAGATPAAAHQLQFAGKWGTFGAGDGQFSHPAGIAFDQAGDTVYVADAANSRVQKFTSDGRFLGKWGTPGTGDGQFRGNAGIDLDPTGRFVYVSDFLGDRVQKFTANGEFLTKWGGTGSGDGQFRTPDGLAVDAAGNVYVTDIGNARVQVFSDDGTFIRKWGSSGSSEGQFIQPHGIDIDGAGHVYVADPNLNRVQKFTSTGDFIRAWGTAGSGNGEFRGVHTVGVHPTGHIYVSDLLNNRVQEFTADGAFLARFGRNGGDGSAGSGDGEFNFPEWVAASPDGDVYVADSNNNRMQKFRVLSAESPAPQAPTAARDVWPPRIRVLGAPRCCTRLGFIVRLRVRDGSGVKRVTVYLDRKRIRITRRSSFSLRVRTRRLRSGRHRLVVRATDGAGNSATRTARFRRCRRR
jgi:DNA-binding beta-propeller fold protein YncE